MKGRTFSPIAVSKLDALEVVSFLNAEFSQRPRNYSVLEDPNSKGKQAWAADNSLLRRKFPNAEQKRPGLITYPNNTVSLVVQMEAWIANHLDPDIESKKPFFC